MEPTPKKTEGEGVDAADVVEAVGDITAVLVETGVVEAVLEIAASIADAASS